jgi:hypothetical protein
MDHATRAACQNLATSLSQCGKFHNGDATRAMNLRILGAEATRCLLQKHDFA